MNGYASEKMAEFKETDFEELIEQCVLGSSYVEEFMPVLKKACESGTQNDLLHVWGVWALQKKEEVEQTCLEYYQMFVEWIERLLNVRQSLVMLTDQLHYLNWDIQRNVAGLASKVGLEFFDGGGKRWSVVKWRD